jgi:hypothetical protein
MTSIINPYKFGAPAAEIILTNQAFDFDADLGITTDASGVTNWTDQSAAAQGDLFAESAARSPALLTNGNPNGDGDAVDFDGAGNRMVVTGGFTLPQPVTVYLVIIWNTWANNDTAIDGNTVNTMVYAQITSTPTTKLFSGTFDADNSDLAIGTWGIVCCVFDNKASSIRVNNNTKTTGTIGTGTPGGITVGARANASSFGDFTVARIIGYDTTAHTNAEQDQMIEFLNDTYTVF